MELDQVEKVIVLVCMGLRLCVLWSIIQFWLTAYFYISRLFCADESSCIATSGLQCEKGIALLIKAV